MARGQEEKQIITDKILSMFDGAIVYDKTIRVPINDVEIKIALTCAKDNICGGPDLSSQTQSENNEAAPALQEPTEEEINNVKNLMEQLDL